MDQATVIKVIQDAVYTILLASAPMLLAGLIVGVIVSIFQATTQIHDQTLAFVPKIVVIFLTLLVFGGFILSTLTEFFQRLYEYIVTIQ